MIVISLKNRHEIKAGALYNQRELEYLFGLSEPSIIKVVKSGKLPFALFGKRRRFLGEVLLKFIKNYPYKK